MTVENKMEYCTNCGIETVTTKTTFSDRMFTKCNDCGKVVNTKR